MNRLLRIIVKIILAVFGVAVILIAGVFVAVNVSPKPFAWYVRTQFDPAGEPVTPTIYHELSQKVRVEKDIEYPSRFRNNRLDVFRPADATGPLPTIIWVHGGGFVGGDKAGIETWATIIAAKGYIVVSINYELAPQNHYPGPVIQLGEVCEFLKYNPQRFPSVDLHRLIIGGDSAGAQIASRFTALQTNAEFARSMQHSVHVSKEDLLAVILYCGPYNIERLYNSESRFLRFFVRQVGWAYFGIREWGDSPEATQASTVEHVTPEFPAAFLTDGNTASFELDARALEGRLKENGVHVDSLYYPGKRGAIHHEYQFDFSTPDSMECYHRALAFLDKVMVGKELILRRFCGAGKGFNSGRS
jgi:acetyl esterase/lipase